MTKKIFSFVAILVLSIGSFFAFFSPKNSEEVAYADTYNVLPDIFVNATNRTNGAYSTSMVVKFSPDLSTFTTGFFSFDSYNFFDPEPTSFSASFDFAYDRWIYVNFRSFISENFFTMQFYCDAGFAFNNIVKIEYYGIEVSDNYPRNVIRFFDSSAKVFRFDFWSFFIVNDTILPGLLYQSDARVLFTAPVDSSTTTWQEAYQNGYDNGLVSGQSSGYSAGYDVGFSAGDAVGYQRGVDASNQYSFGNLFFAVVDTPVVIFRSLFDFNVLGVNLQGFFFSLLTVAVVISVVRFILAK